jgi:CHRD domain-containing protein
MHFVSTRHAVRLALAAALVAGLSTAARAAVISYTAVLNGASESPPNASPATGSATADADATANTLHLNFSWSGLVGTTSASHIHAPTLTAGTGTAGVATTTPYFLGFPIGVTAGTFDITLDLTLSSSYNGSFVTANGGTPAGAEAALLSAIANGKAYLNIHSSVYGGGEIRGFLMPVATPTERTTWGRVKSMYMSSLLTLPTGPAVLGDVAMTAGCPATPGCCE